MGRAADYVDGQLKNRTEKAEAIRRPSGIQLAIKRVIDILGSVFGLLVLSPLFATLPLTEKRYPGPIYFQAARGCGEIIPISKLRPCTNAR